jgi:uncharacterized membrane protein
MIASPSNPKSPMTFNQKQKTFQDSVKFVLGWTIAFAIRLVPFRPANLEPLLAIQMPFAKKYGSLAAFVFGFMSIALFDLITSGLGVWTLITALAYGFLGVASVCFFRKMKSSRLNYAVFAVFATIFYDAVTGLTIGPLFFGQPLYVALIGQIPFTAMHVLGNTVLALTVSPYIERLLVKENSLLNSLVERAFVYNEGIKPLLVSSARK